EEGGFGKRARKERTGCVAFMMIREHDPRQAAAAQAAADRPPHVQLVLEPQRHRHAEAAQSAWRIRQVRLDQSLELGERFVIEGNVVKLIHLQLGLFETVRNRARRKPRIMLLAREPLFLRCGDDLPIDDKPRSTVMIEGRDSQYRRHASRSDRRGGHKNDAKLQAGTPLNPRPDLRPHSSPNLDKTGRKGLALAAHTTPSGLILAEFL